MFQFTPAELEMINDALTMLYNSNKRMQTSKPKFTAIFHAIETDINALKIKLLTPQNKQK